MQIIPVAVSSGLQLSWMMYIHFLFTGCGSLVSFGLITLFWHTKPTFLLNCLHCPTEKKSCQLVYDSYFTHREDAMELFSFLFCLCIKANSITVCCSICKWMLIKTLMDQMWFLLPFWQRLSPLVNFWFISGLVWPVLLVFHDRKISIPSFLSVSFNCTI